MASHRIARLIASGLLLAGAAALPVLGALLVLHRSGGVGADAWLLAWGLLFAVGLPMGAVVLAALGTLAARVPAFRNIPYPVRTIPRSGQ